LLDQIVKANGAPIQAYGWAWTINSTEPSIRFAARKAP
jgi:hypothetical protein